MPRGTALCALAGAVALSSVQSRASPAQSHWSQECGCPFYLLSVRFTEGSKKVSSVWGPLLSFMSLLFVQVCVFQAHPEAAHSSFFCFSFPGIQTREGGLLWDKEVAWEWGVLRPSLL